jgi:hypothetical protein
MMISRIGHRLPGVTATCAGLLLALAACGGDSTAPSSLDSNAALQSLTLGLNGLSDVGSPSGALADPTFGGIAPLLSQVHVTIDGKSQSMFALGLRESFPPGTCEEDLFIDPSFPPQPGVCTPLPLALAVVAWQSHAANAPPDKLFIILADVGTSNFDFLSSVDMSPALALYVDGQSDVWISDAGSLTSAVTATGQACSLPLPPYAKKGSCSVAGFDEQGEIAFEPFTSSAPITSRVNLTIPRQTFNGLWEAITETQPITVSDPPPAFQRMQLLLPRVKLDRSR